MTDHPTNGGPKPPTKTRAEERAESVKTPSRVELSVRQLDLRAYSQGLTGQHR